jgi:hypothetical protein
MFPYPERQPVALFGPFTVHKGKFYESDPLGYWVEGPTAEGRRVVLASYGTEPEAVHRALRMFAAWSGRPVEDARPSVSPPPAGKTHPQEYTPSLTEMTLAELDRGWDAG